ncbi:hypothetical protein FOZ63_029176 [Perkinsus olseni]|uniref:Uncharacterized protein n=1 Tax=Perkinsus olseni TaxID=32597 RepID=A0A7J6NIH9_PEROL|nr:hypothetical protein FOZ63_029176 [Perkinsus olseni]
MTDSYGPPAWGPGGIACYIIALTMVGVIYPLSSIGAIALVGRSAYYRVHDPTTKEDGILRRPSILTSEGGQRMNDSENPLGRNLARFYGIYFGSYAGAGVLLIILGLLLLQLPKQLDLGEYKGLAFWSLGMLSLVGTFLYLGIPPCPRSDVIPGSPVPCVSPWRTFIFPIAHRRFRVYALLLVVCGMVEAYGYVDFVMYISTPRIGPRASSLVTGFALFIDGLVAFMYGWLVYRGFCSLRTVVLLGAIALVLAMAYCAALSAAVMVYSGEGGGKSSSSSILGLNYTRVPDGPERWIEIDDVEVYDYFVVALCIILVALGLLPYKAHLSSVTQQIYQPTPYHLQVSAHLKGLRSLGFMVQMGVDNLISSYYGISQTSNFIAALVILATMSTYKDSSYWLKTVFALAVAKAFVEAGLRSAYVNEVSAFGGSAFFRGFLMLIIEVVVCWMCPMVHRWFELHTAVKYLLFIGGIGAAVHVYYLVLGTALSSFSRVGYISACVTAALLYPLDSVASYVIIGRSAYFCCRDPTRTGASEETLARSNFREMLSKNLSW